MVNVFMPADGMRAATEIRTFGTSGGAALISSYLILTAMRKGEKRLLLGFSGHAAEIAKLTRLTRLDEIQTEIRVFGTTSCGPIEISFEENEMTTTSAHLIANLRRDRARCSSRSMRATCAI